MTDSVQRLLDGVESLNQTVTENNVELSRVRDRLRVAERAQRRHRVALLLTVIGLAIDLALSGLFIYQHVQQNCLNGRSNGFFSAETAKVTGQIDGERRQLKGVQEILQGTRASGLKGIHDFEHGTQIWIHRSQNYLNTIAKLQANNVC